MFSKKTAELEITCADYSRCVAFLDETRRMRLDICNIRLNIPEKIALLRYLQPEIDLGSYNPGEIGRTYQRAFNYAKRNVRKLQKVKV